MKVGRWFESVDVITGERCWTRYTAGLTVLVVRQVGDRFVWTLSDETGIDDFGECTTLDDAQRAAVSAWEAAP